MATSEREMILRGDARAIGILVASEEITIEARYAPGQSVAGPTSTRITPCSTCSGELTLEVGARQSRSQAPVAVHVHAHHTDAFYAPDGGFAAFMRGVRDRVDVEWDIAAVPAGGGAPASDAIISRR